MSTSDARAANPSRRAVPAVKAILWVAAALVAVLGIVLAVTGAGAGLTLLVGLAVGGLIVAAQRSGGSS